MVKIRHEPIYKQLEVTIFYRTHNFSSHRNCGIVALMVLGWSANIRKLAKNHKGYGSAAKELIACLKTVSILVEILILNNNATMFDKILKNKNISFINKR
jgi:hypothetical protein